MNQPKTGSSNEYDQTTPRLFRLRDLHPPKTIATPSPEATHSVSGHPHQAEVAAAEKLHSQGEPYSQTTEHEQHAVANQVAEESGEQIEESPEQIRTRERIERHLDASPEGRSWMESALANRKVLLLLVIAISAAFWTSRGDQNQTESDSELAQTNGTAEFDPTQFDAGTLMGEGEDFFPTEHPGESSSQGLIANSNEPSVHSPTLNPATGQNNNPAIGHAPTAPVTSAAIQNSVMASDSLAPGKTNDVAISTSLGQPAVGVAFPSQPNAPNSAGTIASNAIATNSVSAGAANLQPELAVSQIQSNGLEVQAVSSKTPRDPVFSASSLENLEPSTTPSQLSTELNLKNSNTPNAVSDWLQYLPPQQ